MEMVRFGDIVKVSYSKGYLDINDLHDGYLAITEKNKQSLYQICETPYGVGHGSLKKMSPFYLISLDESGGQLSFKKEDPDKYSYIISVKDGNVYPLMINGLVGEDVSYDQRLTFCYGHRDNPQYLISVKNKEPHYICLTHKSYYDNHPGACLCEFSFEKANESETKALTFDSNEKYILILTLIIAIIALTYCWYFYVYKRNQRL